MLNHSLEDVLAERFQRRHALLTGNGTTALHIALEYARVCKGCDSVTFPEMICQTAINSAVFSGMQTKFIDNDPNSLLANPDYWQVTTQALKNQCLVVVDLFGYMHDDAQLCGTGSFGYVVEDAAQAFFSRSPDRHAGTIGSASIVSFGQGKHIDIGGGGAILTDDHSLLDFGREFLHSISSNPFDRSRARMEHYKQLLQLEKMGLSREQHIQRWHTIYRENRRLFLGNFNLEQEADLWSALTAANESRDALREKQQHILACLASYPVSIIPYYEGSVAWRLTFSLDSTPLRNSLLSALESAGAPVSTLFQPGSILNSKTVPETFAAKQHSKLINIDLKKVDIKLLEKVMNSYDWSR